MEEETGAQLDEGLAKVAQLVNDRFRIQALVCYIAKPTQSAVSSQSSEEGKMIVMCRESLRRAGIIFIPHY